MVKIKNFLSKNEEKLKSKSDINEKIIIKSNAEEVKSFLERILNFKGETNNLDGKTLIELDEEGMVKLGLNFGQKLKKKYIDYFKTLKVEEEQIDKNIDETNSLKEFLKTIIPNQETEKEKEKEVKINFETNKKEVGKFLKQK